MTRDQGYKTLNDGSIDYAHYIRRSHAIRAADAHRFLRALAAALSGLFAGRRPERNAIPSQPTRHAHGVRPAARAVAPRADRTESGAPARVAR